VQQNSEKVGVYFIAAILPMKWAIAIKKVIADD